jgi:hypothetical protein
MQRSKKDPIRSPRRREQAATAAAERLPFKKGVLAPVAFQLAFERGTVIEAVKA